MSDSPPSDDTNIVEQEDDVVEENSPKTDNRNPVKLFVGGLRSGTSDSILKHHFSKYGQVREALVVTDRHTGKSRGFGFVTFQHSSMADYAFQQQHIILGFQVDVKRAVPKHEQNNVGISSGEGINNEDNNGGSGVEGNNNGTEFKTKKIFVGGLPSDLTQQEFMDFFNGFGTVTNVLLKFDKTAGEPRKFGFITFDSEDCVDNVMKQRYYQLKGKSVEVKKATPKQNYPYQSNNTIIGRGYQNQSISTNFSIGYYDPGLPYYIPWPY